MFAVLVALWPRCGPARADVIEFVSGSKVEGRVVERNEKYISFEVMLGGRTFSRTYPVDRVLAVTVDGRREVLNSTTSSGSRGSSERPGASGREPVSSAPLSGGRRTAGEVKALIDELGRTQPEWWDSVPLDYPRTLDLSWPQPPPKGWNNQKNVGQYIWDIVNPNPGKWRHGVRLMHHLLTVHESNPRTRQRVMNELGRMYHDLLQDYARAAFWWQVAGVEKGGFGRSGVHLAECYWKLGSKQMALDLMQKVPPHFGKIKLWAEMGEMEKAIALAQANVKGRYADVAFIYAGDAYRVAGYHEQALQCYERLLKVPVTAMGKGRIERNQQRARANIEAIKLFDMLDLGRVPDGAYRASSPAYAGPLHVEVTVRGGRIVSVRVTEHQEKQFYSAIDDTTRKILQTQGVKGIDATSSATITSEAIINATAKALGSAMR